MIKHWEILENNWTQGSAYVLCIDGQDQDAALITKNLSSFCSEINAKVSNFTHVFELLNVTDDDILQRIRTRIEELVKESSKQDNSSAISADPVQVSDGSLNLFPQEEPVSILDNLPAGSNGLDSSDGTEISIAEAKSTILSNDREIKQDIVKESKSQEQVQPKKKQGFLKRFFSFGSKKDKEKKEEKVLGPLPIENTPTKIKNIVSSKSSDIFKKQTKSFKNIIGESNKNSKGMHGVVVRGSAFPAEELGAQKIKEVSLDAKTLFDKEQEKEQGESLQAQVPLDDIFAAETICKFYDENEGNAEESVVEEIIKPAPVQTPKVISKPTVPEQAVSKEPILPAKPQVPTGPVIPSKPVVSKPAAVPAAPAKPQVPTGPVIPSKPVVSKPAAVPAAPAKPQVPTGPVIPSKPVVSKPAPVPAKPVTPAVPKVQAGPAPVLPKVPVQQVNKEYVKSNLNPKSIAEKIITPISEGAAVSNNIVGENKVMNNEENNKEQMPQISVSSEETFRVKKPVPQDEPAILPKLEINQQDLSNAQEAPKEEKFVPLKQIKAEEVSALSQNTGKAAAPSPANVQQEVKTTAKPVATPRKNTQIDGFDHTIQTSSIPVYKKSNWAIEMPIIPSYTLENLDMSSNRFAHAAAMSTVENPGTMYNPFFVFGESGCGKTHFLNAVGAEFSKTLSQDQIFITNGVRFSRGVQRAIESDSIDRVKSMLENAKVLIIDDIHLTAVNETNREFISKVLNDFVAKRKQIVISSKYPPQGLSRFEELTNFKLSQGRIFELKTLRPNHFIRAYTKMAADAHVDLTEAQSLGFFGRENLTLGMIAKDIKRAKVLSRRIKDSGSTPLSYDQLLSYITAVSGEDTSSQIEMLDLNSPLSIRRGENTDWGNFGFFFPKDNSDKFKWVVYATMQRAKELGIKGGFNFALKSAYSTEHIIASAFKIANICDSKNLKAAIILGPDPKIIQPAIRDNFCDILSHMLEVMMIRCAIISYEDIKKPSSYVKVLGDVLK
jgi:chromosomal replication initiation ATPase DnaA